MLDDWRIEELEGNGHHLFGASKAPRYMRCAGSLLAEIGLPDNASWEAFEGTVAHDLAARWLGGEDVSGEDGKGYTHGELRVVVSSVMLQFIGQYVQFCRDTPGLQYYERKVWFSQLTPIPRQGGTADHIAIDGDHLTITDLKYGTGVQVYAEWNEQAMLYALGVIYEFDFLFDFDRVTIRIAQPRLDHWDVWETTKDELLSWAKIAKEKMAACWKPNAPRNPGEKQCQFCKASSTCPAFVAIRDKISAESFEDESISTPEMNSALATLDYDIVLPETPGLTTAQLAKMLRYRKAMEWFFDKAYEELSKRVAAGEPEPEGWMMAEGRRSRHVADEALVRDLMDAAGHGIVQCYTMAFKSPAQLEATLIEGGMRKRAAEAYLARAFGETPGKPTLALIGPGKKKARDLAGESFDDETL